MSDQITVEAKGVKKAVPTVLEETLLVEVTDPKVGTDAFGNTRKMVLSRAAYDSQKKETQMRVIEVLKPEGVTMAQHLASKTLEAAAKTVAVAANTLTAGKVAVKAAPAPKASPKPKSKTGAPAAKPKAAPVADATVGGDLEEGMTADELKLAIEEQSMKELLEQAEKE